MRRFPLNQMIYGTAAEVSNLQLTHGAVFFATDTLATYVSDGTNFDLIASAVGADMDLSTAQTVTGIKTFEDTTFLLRNVADTFDGSFVNTNTADRIYTLQDAAGTIAFTSDLAVTATASAEGIVELAIVAEADTGTDVSRVMSVDVFAGSDFGTKSQSINVYNMAVEIDTSTGLGAMMVPVSLNGYDIVGVSATVHTLGTSSGAETIDILLNKRSGAVDAAVLSTAITLEKTEYTIADGVIDTAEDDVVTGDLLIPTVVNNLDTTDAKGLIVTIEFRKA